MKVRACLNYRIPVLVFALLALNLEASSPPTTEETQKWEQLMTDSMQTLKSSNVPEAARLCDEALALAANFGPADTRLSQSQDLRAEIYIWEKKNNLAEQTFKLAIRSCEKAVGSNDVALVNPLSCLANFYLSGVARYDQVLPLYQRILKIVENTPHRNHRDVIMWSRNVGMVDQQMGRFAEGEPLFQQAVSLAEQNDATWLPYELLTAAAFYRDWGRYDQAETLGLRALDIRENAAKTGGTDSQIDVAVCLGDLGRTYLAWPKPQKAEAVYRRSLAIVQRCMTGDPAGTIPYIEGLAEALRAQGKFDQAEPLYIQAMTIADRDANNSTRERLLEEYARLLTDLKRTPEAKVILERAAKIQQQAIASQ